MGRGRHQSYCVLLTSNRSPDTLARLRVFASTTDGFKISEEDLKLRGPGDFFGRRQHGLPTLRLADLSGDMRLLSEAQQAARDLLSADPRLALGKTALFWSGYGHCSPIRRTSSTKTADRGRGSSRGPGLSRQDKGDVQVFMVRRLCMCQLDLDAIPGTVLDVIQILDMLPPVHLLRCPRGGHAVECVLRPSGSRKRKVKGASGPPSACRKSRMVRSPSRQA